jgi:hypothetical protein
MTDSDSSDDADDRPDGDARDPFERFPIDPIGTGLAVVILVVGVALLLAGPLSVLYEDPGPPETEWTTQRVNDTHVQVVHVDGESVDADRLVLTVDGTQRSPDWPETVSSGTVVIVEASPGSTVAISWEDDDRYRLANLTA